MAKRVLVLGGAGFVGSAIARAFVEAGWRTEIIDCLHPAGFADSGRLDGLSTQVTLTRADIGRMQDLPEVFARFDVVVDAMGLSRHLLGDDELALDLELNLGVHLPVFAALASDGPRLIHLGTLHQFGGATGMIDDDAPFAPIDVQGIHKCAAEQHLRLACRRSGASAAVLRIGNCIGPGQPQGEGDVGLFGGLLRDLAAGQAVDVFEGNRARHLCFTPDIGRLAVMLADAGWSGFTAMNFSGELSEILGVAKAMQQRLGSGTVNVSPLPEALARREIAPAVFPGARLTNLLPSFTPTPVAAALETVIGDLTVHRAGEIG